MSIDIEDFEFALAERFRSQLRLGESIVMPPTPRTLAALLARRRAAAPSPVSLTARAFFRIRAALADQLGLEPSAILPGTRCRDLMTDLTLRRAQWSHFRERLGIREAPRLARSGRLAWTIAIVTAAVMLAAAIGATAVLPTFPIFPMILLAGGAAVAAALRLTRHWARLFLPRDLTVGHLAHYAVAYGSSILGDCVHPATTSQTLEVIQSLARLEIGAPHLDPDANWEELDTLAHVSQH
jgi:hypothetical protein